MSHQARIPALLLAITTLAAPAAAQEAEGPGHRGEWGVLAGAATGKVFDPARTETDLALAGFRWGRRLGARPGPVAVLVEVLPVFTVSQRPRAWGPGLNLLLRYTPGSGAWRPLLLGGVGLVVTNEKVPPGETHLNFTPQVGAGLRRMLSDDLVLTVEYRFHHLSNASLSESNPGINSHMGLLVLSWLH